MSKELTRRISSNIRTSSMYLYEDEIISNQDLATYNNIEYELVFSEKDPIALLENAEKRLRDCIPWISPKNLYGSLSFKKQILLSVLENVMTVLQLDSTKVHFLDVYKPYLVPLLVFFNIKRKYYEVIANYLQKGLTDEKHVSRESLEKLFYIFAESIKFFREDKYPWIIDTFIKPKKLNFSYTIKCIRAYSTNKTIDDPSQLFDGKVCIKDFPFQNSLRSDNLIIFGTNACCDIVLPKAEHLEAISVVLFISENNVSVKDYLKTSHCLVQLLGRRDHFEERSFPGAVIWKPELPKQSLRIKAGMVFNIGRALNLHIESIIYNFQNSKESELIFRYLNAELKNKTERISNFKRTHTKSPGDEENTKESIIKQNNFTLGRGSKGVAPDIHIPSKFNSVCGRHCEFIFDDQLGWHICDENSKNGTYFVTKTSEDIANSRPSSKAFKIFRSNSDEEFPHTRSIFLLIAEKYRFLIEAKPV